MELHQLSNREGYIPMTKIARDDKDGIIASQIRSEDLSEMLFLVLPDGTDEHRDDRDIFPRHRSRIQNRRGRQKQKGGDVQDLNSPYSVRYDFKFGTVWNTYPSKTLRTYERCISILCSASSVSTLISSNSPVPRSSSIAASNNKRKSKKDTNTTI